MHDRFFLLLSASLLLLLFVAYDFFIIVSGRCLHIHLSFLVVAVVNVVVVARVVHIQLAWVL